MDVSVWNRAAKKSTVARFEITHIQSVSYVLA